jgi:hypothetical protein
MHTHTHPHVWHAYLCLVAVNSSNIWRLSAMSAVSALIRDTLISSTCGVSESEVCEDIFASFVALRMVNSSFDPGWSAPMMAVATSSCVCMSACMCVCMCMCVYVYVCMFMCKYALMMAVVTSPVCACMYTCMYVCVCVCMCLWWL